MPGSPTSRNSRPRPATASSRPAVSSASSRSRPTKAPATTFAAGVLDRGEVEPRILGQDRALELAQPLARLDAQLVGQRAAGVAVGLQRVGLPVGAVQREHQLRPQPLAVGVLGDQRARAVRAGRRGGPARARPRSAAPARRRGGRRAARSRAGRTARRPDPPAARPRHSASASSSVDAARAGRPAASSLRPSATRRSKRPGVELLGVERELVAVLAGRDLPHRPRARGAAGRCRPARSWRPSAAAARPTARRPAGRR